MTATPDQRMAVTRDFMTAANRLTTLWDLEDTGMQMIGILESGDLDPAEQAEAEANLALIDQLMMEKTESYVSVIRTLESMADARKAEADRLKARAATAQQHADWLRSRLLTHMQVTGRDRIETVRFTLSVRQNPLSVQVIDAAAIPPEFERTKTETTIDRRAIIERFKRDGEVIPGVELVRGVRLEVR